MGFGVNIGLNTENALSQKLVFDQVLDWWRMNGVEVLPLPKQTPAPIIPPDKKPAPIFATKSINKPNDVVNEARKIASECKTIDELKNAIANFDDFHLKKTATNMVFCDGQDDAQIMLIGEAPGREEEEAEKPFIGPSGQLLDEMLGSIGLSRNKNVYITNIINWRPPGNRAPSKEEVAISLPFLQKHIELKRPKIIILIGAVSASAILNSNDGITKLRKNKHEIEFEIDGQVQKIPCFAIFHPAYLMRRPNDKSLAWRDLLNIQAKLKELKITFS